MNATTNKSAPEPNAPPRREERKLPVEASSFSAERILNRAATTSRSLSRILERHEDGYYSSHWGLNE